MMKEGHNSLLNVLCIKYSTYKINYVLQLDRQNGLMAQVSLKGNLSKL